TQLYKAAPIDVASDDPRELLREALGKGLKALAGRSVKTVAVLLPALDLTILAGLFEVPVLMSFNPAPYKTKTDDAKPFPITEVFFCTATAGTDKKLNALCREAQILAEAVNLARKLANEPANLLTPKQFVQEAGLLQKLGIEVRTLSPALLKKMGGVQAVGAGSENSPQFLIMELNPGKQKPIVLIGKGVTFDSGGISIKPADGMAEMKNDMGGGAAVVGAMAALARLGYKKHVVGLVPLVENMPDGRALKPSDVITMFDGQTVEVLNTDAEGRLILADAVAYAATLNPEFTVDIATLTGAVIIALGNRFTGTFTTDEALYRRLETASQASYDLIWRLPLHKTFTEEMKSTIADWRNLGGSRKAGASLGAAFIGAFAKGPWAHLDIGGSVMVEKANAYMPAGPSGAGVRLLTRLVLSGR
ncbi:MAG TPA: leucyl aminopeptidase, partial [Candidatus Ozemobacteraceae bacterium]|nr:leucyl aminopeptidase [Candidatus Ozemobacteraceae bacterium]